MMYISDDAHHCVGFSDSQIISDSQMGGAATQARCAPWCRILRFSDGVGFSDGVPQYSTATQARCTPWCLVKSLGKVYGWEPYFVDKADQTDF